MTRPLLIVLAVLAGLALGLRARPPRNGLPPTPQAENLAPPPASIPPFARRPPTEPPPPRATPAAAPQPEPTMVGPDGVIYRRVRPGR